MVYQKRWSASFVTKRQWCLIKSNAGLRWHTKYAIRVKQNSDFDPNQPATVA